MDKKWKSVRKMYLGIKETQKRKNGKAPPDVEEFLREWCTNL